MKAANKHREFLYVTGSFPPLIGAGVHRVERNCGLLPQFNWRPTILTPAVDNNQDVDSRYAQMGIEVLRGSSIVKENRIRALPKGTSNEKPPFSTQMLRFLAHWLLIPDRQVLWKLPAQRLAVKAAKRHDWQCVFATLPSISSGWVGKSVARRLQLPFVLEYRDIIDETFKAEAPSALHRAALCSIERSLVRSAAKIVVVSPAMKDWLVHRHGLNPQQVELITNGFTQEDYDFFHSLPEQRNDRFTMIYAGLFHGQRKPDITLKAVRGLIDRKVIPADKLRVIFIGNLAPASIPQFGLDGIAETIGMIPRKEVLQWYAHSDLLLLICAKNKYQNLTYPGKLFEYLMTEKPILGLMDKNSGTAQLLEQSGIGLVADAGDVEETAGKIEHLYKLWACDKLKMKPNSEVIRQFGAWELTKKLASIFEQVSNR